MEVSARAGDRRARECAKRGEDSTVGECAWGGGVDRPKAAGLQGNDLMKMM